MNSKFFFVEAINAPLPNIEPTLAIDQTHPPNIQFDPGQRINCLAPLLLCYK